MGTINCTVNSDQTITVTEISGMNAQNTWARLHGVVIEIAGGATFNLAFSVVEESSAFRFDTTDPIEWLTSPPPSWIQVSGTPTATALTLQAVSPQTLTTSPFRIRNTATGAEPIDITVTTPGGSGATGGTLNAYIGDDQTALVGQLPPGAEVTGTDVHFGFKDSGENELLFAPAGTVVINGLEWNPSEPSYVEVNETSSEMVFSIGNDTSEKLEAAFTLDTNHGTIDPTIITNPDENAP